MYSFPLQQTEQEEVDDAVARAKAKRASMVKKALRYFEDKSNRSMSEDNLFTRRKNLAVHLGAKYLDFFSSFPQNGRKNISFA